MRIWWIFLLNRFISSRQPKIATTKYKFNINFSISLSRKSSFKNSRFCRKRTKRCAVVGYFHHVHMLLITKKNICSNYLYPRVAQIAFVVCLPLFCFCIHPFGQLFKAFISRLVFCLSQMIIIINMFVFYHFFALAYKRFTRFFLCSSSSFFFVISGDCRKYPNILSLNRKRLGLANNIIMLLVSASQKKKIHTYNTRKIKHYEINQRTFTKT